MDLAHGILSKSAKLENIWPRPAKSGLVEVRANLCQRTGIGDRKVPLTLYSLLGDLPAGLLSPEFCYKRLIAADEKIPLSVVSVKKKPQHLVFICESEHQLAKHGHLPVESSNAASRARTSV
jgi:hypothetical protein